MHIHASAMQAVVIFAMVLVIGTGWRLLSMHLSDTTAGKAMAVMY